MVEVYIGFFHLKPATIKVSLYYMFKVEMSFENIKFLILYGPNLVSL
jgi:hypothetical protein